MDTLLTDLRFAFRLLRKSPAFTVVAVLSLALGIGANAAIFTLVDAALLRPLPVADSGGLVRLRNARPDGSVNNNFSQPAFEDYRAGTDVFAGIFAQSRVPAALDAGGGAERVEGDAVSASQFAVLGVTPRLGRFFLPEEDRAGAAPVLVLSERLWRDRFGADPAVVGRTVRLNGLPFEVIGVAPASFTGITRGERSDFWTPLSRVAALTGDDYSTERRASWLTVIARLGAGVSVERAEAALAILDGRLIAEKLRPEGERTILADASRGLTSVVGDISRPLLVLMAAVAVVLLIACANIANLLLARTRLRGREVAIRLSLGASRPRLTRQMLTESVLLSLIGAAAGMLIAAWTVDLLTQFHPPTGATILLDTTPDARVLGFTFAIALVTGVLFGIVPALAGTGEGMFLTLREGQTTNPGGRGTVGLRGALVVGQVALSLVLLVVAGLLVRSFANLADVDVGYGVDDALLVDIDLDAGGYTAVTGTAFYRELLERARALPDVEAASLARTINPHPYGSRAGGTNLEGYAAAPDENVEYDVNTIATGYFETLGVRLLAGRSFDERDVRGATRVIIINRTMAERYWPGLNPVGLHIGADPENGDPGAEIIGIAADGKYRSLREEATNDVYVPVAQSYRPSLTFVARTAGDPMAAAASVRRVIREMDPAVPAYGVRTLRDHVELSLSQDRMAAILAGLFATLAMLLAAIGLYGVIAGIVTQRTREIGLRMALGARPGAVLALVVRRAMTLVTIGLALGFVGAIAASRALGTLLFRLSPTDPVTFAGVATLLAIVAAVASYLPARRAARVDPMVTLRE